MKRNHEEKNLQKLLGFVNFFGEVPIAPYCWLFNIFFYFIFVFLWVDKMPGKHHGNKEKLRRSPFASF